MKKIISLILVATLTLVIASCGKKKEEDTSSIATSTSSAESSSSSKASSSSSSQASSSSKVSSSSSSATSSSSTSSAVTESKFQKLDLKTLFLGGIEERDAIVDMDSSAFVTSSHSLQAKWASGYGIGFLFDGVLGNGQWPINVGTYVSCTLAGDGSTLEDVNKTANVAEWIQVKLPSAYTIDKVSMYGMLASANRGFPTVFNIQVSADGSNWTTVYTTDNYRYKMNKPQDFVFTATKCQYIKINAAKIALDIDTALKYSFGLSELEIYGQAA